MSPLPLAHQPATDHAAANNPLIQLLPLSGGAVAVAGLMWRPLTTPKLPKSETKQLLQQTQCDYFVLHHADERTQCGLAPALPDQPTYYSAALLLIEQLGNDWVAIFQLPDGRYLLIGVEGGQVVPGCEGVLATDTAVTEHFERYQLLFNWQTRYAPSHLNLGGEERVLEALLNSSSPKAAHQLRSYYGVHTRAKRLASYLGGGLGLLIMLLIAVGWQHYQQQQTALRLAKQRLLQAQQQQKKQQIQQAWRQQPPAKALLSACVRTLSHYPVTLGGWRIVSGHCSAQQAQATYQRLPPHTVKGFLAVVRQRYGECYQFTSGSAAQIKQSLTIPGNRTQEQLQPMLTIVSNILQKMEHEIATGQIDDVLTKPKKSANFELTSDILPSVLLRDIDLAGVVIHRLNTMISADGKVLWKLSGSVYGQ